MEFLLLAVIILLVVVVLRQISNRQETKPPQSSYSYTRKETIMTPAEIAFYKRLETLAGDRYAIFPQIHLSALAKNQTKGKYYKLGYQRINRRSVDYVLCDKDTLKPIYAVELDDKTHDTQKRQARDTLVDAVLHEIGIPIVRFRNVNQMSDNQIIERFVMAHDNATASVDII